MSKSMRTVVVIAIVAAGLLALSVEVGRESSLKKGIAEAPQRAKSILATVSGKLAPMASVRYWKKLYARKIEELKESASPNAPPSAGPPERVIVVPPHRKFARNTVPQSLPASPHPGSIPNPAPKAVANSGADKAIMSSAFDGCWQGTVNQPDTWEFVQGPVVEGWAPATYTLCFHRAGDSTEANFTMDTSLRLGSQWVTPNMGEADWHSEILFQGRKFAFIHSTSKTLLRLRLMGFLPGPTPTISYNDYLQCDLAGRKLRVEATMVSTCKGSSLENCHGKPWVRESWHALFSKVSPSP